MTTLVGHDKVVRILERSLPPVTLLKGPPGIGKWTLALHLAEHYNVLASDRLLCSKLSVEQARNMVNFVSTSPFGRFKLILARLDNASGAALNAMLKTLEEPPPTARFILTHASATTLATIASRAQTYNLGVLTPEQLYSVLVDEKGMPPAAAKRAAAYGRGRVDVAIQAELAESSRVCVLTIVRALATRDQQLFDRAFRSFDEQAKGLLLIWLHEAITGQWCLFTEADAFGLDPMSVRKILLALSQLNNARARIGVRAALQPFLSRK